MKMKWCHISEPTLYASNRVDASMAKNESITSNINK